MSKKVSKKSSIKRLKDTIRENKEGYWTSNYFNTETQIQGLFSRILKGNMKSPKTIETATIPLDEDDKNQDTEIVEYDLTEQNTKYE